MTQNLYLISLNKTMVEKEQIKTPNQRSLESGRRNEEAESIMDVGKNSSRNFLRTLISR
ncbi:MAG TPA: hypothetical protein PLI47_02630 [Bacteroidia bacterium]|nr:hypothetical protein [Bacteroidia bacterium]